MKIYDTTGKEKGNIELPSQFSEAVRFDLIQRAIFVIQGNNRQPYGASPEAGKRASAKLSKRRKNYRGSYGHGISRTPRKILSRRGTQMYWVGAFAPNTVGGRRAHPPKVEKVWTQKVNKKERRKAIRSAMAAVVDKKIVIARGHKVPEDYPFVLSNDFEGLSKTKEVKEALIRLKLKEELERSNIKSIRAGRGKLRGRKYKRKVGPLLVVGGDCKLNKAAKNIAGVAVVRVNNLNAELLAPGCSIGRLTLFTESAIKKLEKEKLFM